MKFEEMILALIDTIKEKNEDGALNNVLDLLNSAFITSKERSATFDALKAQIFALKKEESEAKERAYKLADERPIISNLSEYLGAQRVPEREKEEAIKAEEERASQARALLKGLR